MTYQLFLLLVITSVLTTPASFAGQDDLYHNAIQNPGDGLTEYWAVIVGVDYKWYDGGWHIPFEDYATTMYETLLTSEQWEQDHILLLTEENATMINIIASLLWLDCMDDGDDYSFVYYSAHGGNLKDAYYSELLGRYISIDIPPIDEADGYDEFLTTYWTAKRNLTFITDDLFNFLLSRLDSQGIAVVIDACYSGGIIDENQTSYPYHYPYEPGDFFPEDYLQNTKILYPHQQELSNDSHALPSESDIWITEFSGEISQEGQVMVTSSGEPEAGWVMNSIDGFIGFSHFVSLGFQGYADEENGNQNGAVSMEEMFSFADPLYRDFIDNKCHPVIDDRFTGELSIKENEFPPTQPEWSNGTILSTINTLCSYQISSTDPEDHEIKYGWDWNVEGGRSLEGSGKVVGHMYTEINEWSPYLLSGELCTMNHMWDTPGIYDIRVQSQDEQGAEILLPHAFGFSDDWTTIITDSHQLVDQYQVKDSYQIRPRVNNTKWCAQSFVPTQETLSKVAVELIQTESESLILTLKKNSYFGETILEYSQYIEEFDLCSWVEFDFEDISIIPGETYIIILSVESDDPDYRCYWIENDRNMHPNPYEFGRAYRSNDAGQSWEPLDSDDDFTFVVYSSTDDSQNQEI